MCGRKGKRRRGGERKWEAERMGKGEEGIVDQEGGREERKEKTG